MLAYARAESNMRAAIGQPISAKQDVKAINDGRSTEGATIRARFSKTFLNGHAQMQRHRMAQAKVCERRENLAVKSSDDSWSNHVGVIDRGIFSVFVSCHTYQVWSYLSHFQSAPFLIC